MAFSSKCAGCETETSYVFAAQFRSLKGCEKIICFNCWESGIRCYYDGEKLTVASELPSILHKEALLYYNEGGYVTGDMPMTYPSTEQPYP